MSAAPASRRHLISLLMVALWAGWTGIGLANIGSRPAVDPAALLVVHERLPAAVRNGHAPVAVLLSPRCSCDQDIAARSAIDQAMTERGGSLQVFPPQPGRVPDVELIVFDPQGLPVYSGPLSPPPGSCGSADTTDPRSWLYALMDGRQPPLHLGPLPCTC